MKRRLLAASAALVLLLAGTLVLLTYVRGADARALEGVQTVEVLVADQLVPQGTTADGLDALVRTDVLPRKAAVEGRVTDLAELSGLVATVDIQPGEQLLLSRFGEAAESSTPGAVEVPDGLQEVSVLLEPQRAIGGRLAAGDTVGVLVSTTGEKGGLTKAVLHDVLVTQVQGAPTPVDPDAEAAAEDGTDTASSGAVVPSQSLMITLAVTASQAEAVVFGMENGTIWLSLEPDGATTGGTDVVDGGAIYEREFQ